MELLDNLPHDKVVRCRNTGDVMQAEIALPTHERLDARPQEVWVPLKDGLLQRILRMAPEYMSSAPERYFTPHWIPTVISGVIQRLYQDRPNSSVLLADFDWLPLPVFDKMVSTRRPDTVAPAIGDPLVTDMNDIDHECYVSAPPLCDILFPTDFDKLAVMAQRELESYSTSSKTSTSTIIAQRKVHVMKQAEFLRVYGPEQIQNTRSTWTGFTPLLEDFSNCSVLTIGVS